METLFNNINFERYYNVLTLLSAIMLLYAIASPTVYVDRSLLITFSLGFFTVGLSEIINHRMENQYKISKRVPIDTYTGEILGNGINVRINDGKELVRRFKPLGIFMLILGISIISYGAYELLRHL